VIGIRRITAERGYQRTGMREGLVSQRSEFRRLRGNRYADPFIGEVISGVEEVAAQHDYSIILKIPEATRIERWRLFVLSSRGHDGVLVIAAMAGGAPSPISEREIPIVLINNHYPQRRALHCVANFEGTADHTASAGAGPRRIGYIGNKFGDKPIKTVIAAIEQPSRRRESGMRLSWSFIPKARWREAIVA